MLYDFRLLLLISPAILLAMYAQFRLKSTYAKSSQIAARLSGYAAARRILDANGLHHIEIEQTPGHLSDHYDPRAKVLRLSSEVYHGRSMAAVGVAAHEAGHALQDARSYAPLILRNAAVPMAGIGSKGGMILLIMGVVLNWPTLLLAGIALFSCVVFFQVVNLPVEYDASARAKRQLVDLQLVDQNELPYVRKVLSAAALTYVAGTLQSVLTLLFYVMRYMGRSRD